MLAQVLEELFPGEPYTSSDGTLENVVFENKNIIKPKDDIYERTVHILTNVEAFKKMREERNALLEQSDKYMMPDYPHPLEQDIQNWKDYRFFLRILPLTALPTLGEDGQLENVEWPDQGEIAKRATGTPPPPI
tara:strand:+ start:1267 stop:1668 length:402 start_codon:yes stop_codon:yes gene_type:complete